MALNRTRSYEAIALLAMGMIFMFLGFFMYIGGWSQVPSLGVMFAGVVCEILGFFLAYLGYKSGMKDMK
jgi:hypothetical protein